MLDDCTSLLQFVGCCWQHDPTEPGPLKEALGATGKKRSSQLGSPPARRTHAACATHRSGIAFSACAATLRDLVLYLGLSSRATRIRAACANLQTACVSPSAIVHDCVVERLDIVGQRVYFDDGDMHLRRISKGQIAVPPLDIQILERRPITVATFEPDVVDFRRQPSRCGVDQTGKFRQMSASAVVARADAGRAGERADPEAICAGL
jgi:hypothetical protein